MRRLFDLLLSFIALLFLSPILIITMVLIKFQDNGPVFFIQKRIGLFGKDFNIYKFRTMYGSNKSDHNSFDVGNVSRITPLGKKMRKLKLDEIPQLINVFIGDMSIVGPRPEVKQWTEVYPEKWKIVHSVRPGITDNASILFRNEEEILTKSSNPTETYRNEILPRKLDLYIDYVNNHSFLGDLKIIFQTVRVVLKG